MASCLDDTEEKTNGTKLSRLLIDGGTEVLRSTFDSIHPPAILAATLHTHLPVLTHLRHKKRILNSSQWDKLFPSSGAAPDSKQFDITLLYILLRNICGLTPPATGWDSLPLATDTTLEANLARIKYYRNEVYGHLSSTGVQKAEFEQYWKEITGALVALGMDQTSVDVLKSSPLGVTDYLKLLDEWTVAEQTLKEVAKKARKAAEETTKVVEETKSVAQETRDTSDETKLVAERTRKVAEETKSVAQETRDMSDETKLVAERTREAAEETKSEVEQVRKAVEQGRAEIEETRAAAMEAKVETEKTGETVKENTLKIDKLFDEVCLMREQKTVKDSLVLSKLAKSDFTGRIKELIDQRHPDTRKWVLSQIQEFIDNNQSHTMVITAQPGVGKSVLAAVTCQTIHEQNRLAATQFIEHNNSLRNRPKLIIESIASHLCDIIPGFQEKLEERLTRNFGKKLDDMNCTELFNLLLEEPLNSVEVPSESRLVVMDALDECDPSKKDEFIKALAVPCNS